jgi:hypothetical protein
MLSTRCFSKRQDFSVIKTLQVLLKYANPDVDLYLMILKEEIIIPTTISAEAQSLLHKVIQLKFAFIFTSFSKRHRRID